MSHVFVVCAYRDSKYIGELFEALSSQTRRSKVIVTTSTPVETMMEKADSFGFPVIVNPMARGIAADWNFAYDQADADYVTLAHQDDIYLPEYAERVLGALEQRETRGRLPILAYTRYFEIRHGERVDSNTLLRVKNLMNAPIRLFPGSGWIRNRMLSMGCPISCPAVTYNKKRFPDFRFDETMKNDMDWEGEARLASEKGDYIYLNTPLVGHRVHADSATTININDGDRYREDYMMYKKYWPDPIARFLLSFYSRALKSNYTGDKNE